MSSSLNFPIRKLAIEGTYRDIMVLFEYVKMDEHGKAAGLESNVAATLSYVLGWLSGLIILLVDGKDSFVRFHAMQSIIFFGGVTAICVIFWAMLHVPYVNVLFMVLLSIVGLFVFVSWLVLMVKAYQKDSFKLPWVGSLAEKYSNEK